MSESLKKSALNLLNRTKESVSEIKDKTLQELEISGTLDELKKKREEVKEYMDQNGITEKAEFGISKAKEYSDIAGEHLDQASGKKILELVEQRLNLQTDYNDLLATKLDEALSRIKELENLIIKK
jgi:hypothetical protein